MRRDEFEEGLDERLTRALGVHALAPPAAPAGFTARVMARTRRARTARPALPLFRDPMPWWVRAAAQPALVLAVALGAIVLTYHVQVAETAMLLASRTLVWLGVVATPFQREDPFVQTALLVSMGIMGLLAAAPLYLWSRGLSRTRISARATRARA